MADDKVMTKRVLLAAGIPTPDSIAVLTTLLEVSRARTTLERAADFVVKPARGRRGGGIIVVTGREGHRFRTAGGTSLEWDHLRRAMADILFGVHSVGQADVVLIERRIRAHPDLGSLAVSGLPDIRVILLHGVPVSAMMRVATRASGGRANIHQGALGLAVRLGDGLAFRCVSRRKPVEAHPDTGAPVTGFRVPLWEGVLDVARRTARAIPLPYLGVDIILDAGAGPMVMEVNARPGLEIQNVNGMGLRRRLDRVRSDPPRAGGEPAR